MNDEKTLDDALDEFDRWGEELYKKIGHLSPEERVAYFQQALDRYEQKTGKRLNLRRISSPPERKNLVRILDEQT